MRIKLSFIVLVFLISCINLSGQNYKVNMKLGFWADTTDDKEGKEIITLLKNYLESTPDSVYDNPYWNTAEKQEYKEFDLSRNSMFFPPAYTAAMLFKEYDAYVLKTEKKDSVYYIQTMYFSTKLDSSREAFNPLAIVNYCAIREGGVYKLANPLKYITQDWQKKEYKYATFHFNGNKYFKDSLAVKSDEFCDSLITRFNFPKPKRIDFYIVNGVHEVGRILGYDHYIYGFAYGKSINNIIISGNKTVFYPHELVHQLVTKYPKRYYQIEEGFATWLGGTMGKDYQSASKKFASDYRKIDTASFSWAWKCEVLSCNVLFAIVVDMIYEHSGDESVLAILNSPISNEEEFYQQVEKLTGWNKQVFTKKWEEKINQLAEAVKK